MQTFTLGEEYTINSNTVNSAHVTVTRRRNNRGYNPDVINANTLGVTVYQAEPNGLQLTAALGQEFTIGGGTNSVCPFQRQRIDLRR